MSAGEIAEIFSYAWQTTTCHLIEMNESDCSWWRIGSVTCARNLRITVHAFRR